MRKTIPILIAFFIVCFCGVAVFMYFGDKPDTLPDQTDASVATATITASPAVTDVPAEPVYDGQLKLYTKCRLETADGKKAGTAILNLVQRNRFGDWLNEESVKHSVNYSFAVNVSLRLSPLMKKYDDLTIKCKPELCDAHGDVYGTQCDIGWSGFSDTASLTTSSPTKTIEFCVQPEQKLKKGSKLKIEFYSLEDSTLVLKPVYVTFNQLKNAKKGPKILTTKQRRVITSICGAKYAIIPKQVSFEMHKRNDKPTDDALPYYDIDYQYQALKKPTNARNVANIVAYNGKDCIAGHATLGVQSNNSGEIYYQATKDAVRNSYENQGIPDLYYTKSINLPFGKSATYTINRAAAESDTNAPRFVRIRVEFPEESDVRTDKQKLKFNGRYLVYQIKITERKLAPSPY